MNSSHWRFSGKTILLLCFLSLVAGFSFHIGYQAWQEFKQETDLSYSITTPYECGVVLTGGPGRIREGVRLLDAQLIKKLIISGVSPNLDKKDLVSKTELHPQIYLDKKSRSTYGNAIHTTSAMVGLGCHDLVLITSSLHTYRAYRVFRSLLPEPFPLSRQTVGPTYEDATYLDLFWEMTKTVFYRIWIYDT